MKKILLTIGLLVMGLVASYAQSSPTPVVPLKIQQNGTTQGYADTVNCTTGMTCTVSSGVAAIAGSPSLWTMSGANIVNTNSGYVISTHAFVGQGFGGSYYNNPITPYDYSHMSLALYDGQNNGFLGIFSQTPGNYWNFLQTDASGNWVSRFTMGDPNDGTITFSSIKWGNAVFIVGGYGGGFGSSYMRITDPTSQGVELGDGSGVTLDVKNGGVYFNSNMYGAGDTYHDPYFNTIEPNGGDVWWVGDGAGTYGLSALNNGDGTFRTGIGTISPTSFFEVHGSSDGGSNTYSQIAWYSNSSGNKMGSLADDVSGTYGNFYLDGNSNISARLGEWDTMDGALGGDQRVFTLHVEKSSGDYWMGWNPLGTGGGFQDNTFAVVGTGTAHADGTNTMNCDAVWNGGNSLEVCGSKGLYIGSSATNSAVSGSAPSKGIYASGQIQSGVSTGTAPFIVASTTNVANLNASFLSGATFASPGAIGGTTASTGKFTSITGTSYISGSTSGVNCIAASMNILTEVVTTGIVTHC